MKKGNGFTLVELLAVIVILALVLIIAVPGVLNIIKNAKEDSYKNQIRLIEDAAKNYVSTRYSAIEWTNLSDGKTKTSVELEVLQKEGLIEQKVIDPRDKKEITCITIDITRSQNNKFTYHTIESCTRCSAENVCVIGEPVTLKDSTKWHVVTTSENTNDMVLLLRDEPLDFDKDDQDPATTGKLMAFGSTSLWSPVKLETVAYYLNNSYKQALLSNGLILNEKSELRLIKDLEYQALYSVAKASGTTDWLYKQRPVEEANGAWWTMYAYYGEGSGHGGFDYVMPVLPNGEYDEWTGGIGRSSNKLLVKPVILISKDNVVK